MTTEGDIVAAIESILGRRLFVSSGDLDLLGERDSEDHLIVEPLKKGAASDFFIVYGADRVSYLKVKTVPDGQDYDLRFDAKGNGAEKK